jgi:hypothetical protein
MQWYAGSPQNHLFFDEIRGADYPVRIFKISGE